MLGQAAQAGRGIPFPGDTQNPAGATLRSALCLAGGLDQRRLLPQPPRCRGTGPAPTPPCPRPGPPCRGRGRVRGRGGPGRRTGRCSWATWRAECGRRSSTSSSCRWRRAPGGGERGGRRPRGWLRVCCWRAGGAGGCGRAELRPAPCPLFQLFSRVFLASALLVQAFAPERGPEIVRKLNRLKKKNKNLL